MCIAPPLKENVFIVPDNLSPDFVTPLPSNISLDMSATPLTTSYDFDLLSDYEGDPFIVDFSGTSMEFISTKLNQDGTIKVILIESRVK